MLKKNILFCCTHAKYISPLGIYMKTRWNDSAPVGSYASISDILYQNITMESPQQYAIWIGE